MHRWGRFRQTVAAIVLVAAAGGPVQAGYEEGRAAYDKGDYETALAEWLPLAVQGDARAQKRVGDLYADGAGVPENDRLALEWYLKSAEQGLASAQTMLGLIYESGQVVPQDYAVAVNWYRRAAAQNDPVGQSSLAAMYQYGYGVPTSIVAAYALYNLSPLNRFYAEILERGMSKADSKAGENLTRHLSHTPAFLETLDAAINR